MTANSSESPLFVDIPEQVSAFRKAIRRWYRRQARDLPWREDDDPYKVWISETMLQQTQVGTVLDYFHRFLERFPDVRTLAAADESDVLRVWEGLGYYRRARQIHRAAQIIVEDFGGRIPDTYEALVSLPGVGRYTAGAILSIAFGKPVPILEANTRRLYARLMGLRDGITSGARERILWDFAEKLVAKPSPGELNQALMELGSLICTPQAPQCDECPVSTFCVALAEDRIDSVASTRKQPASIARHDVAFLIRRADEVLLVQYASGGHWEGLWEFPRVTLPQATEKHPERKAAALFQRHYNLRARPVGKRLRRIHHSVTRYRITLDFFEAELEEDFPSTDHPKSTACKTFDYVVKRWKWLRRDALSQLPFTGAGRKLAGGLL
ncbi:A/G-specific adenine glycosylase [Thermostilla marina]